MDKSLAIMAIACAWTGFIIIIFCFFPSYSIKKYDRILSNYIKRNPLLPAPYSLFFHAGFFGSFGVSYFFCRIIEKKRVAFMSTTSINIYDFENTIESDVVQWFKKYYKLSKILFILYSLFMLMATIQILIIKPDSL